MPNTVITSAEQATPEWLTAALATSGALSAGTVMAVDLVPAMATGRTMYGFSRVTLPTRLATVRPACSSRWCGPTSTMTVVQRF